MVKMQVQYINTQQPQQLQGDTGTNTSATDNLALLHDFRLFDTQEEVSVFLNNNDSSDVVTLKANGIGYIYVLSDQETTMRWETVYTPNGSSTVLLPDNYLNNNTDNYYSFQHRANCNNQGNITFTDKDNNIIESIVMMHNHSGQ